MNDNVSYKLSDLTAARVGFSISDGRGHFLHYKKRLFSVCECTGWSKYQVEYEIDAKRNIRFERAGFDSIKDIKEWIKLQIAVGVEANE
jgi:hypothetical protein